MPKTREPSEEEVEARDIIEGINEYKQSIVNLYHQVKDFKMCDDEMERVFFKLAHLYDEDYVYAKSVITAAELLIKSRIK
jgi:hypothetical protein